MNDELKKQVIEQLRQTASALADEQAIIERIVWWGGAPRNVQISIGYGDERRDVTLVFEETVAERREKLALEQKHFEARNVLGDSPDF